MSVQDAGQQAVMEPISSIPMQHPAHPPSAAQTALHTASQLSFRIASAASSRTASSASVLDATVGEALAEMLEPSTAEDGAHQPVGMTDASVQSQLVTADMLLPATSGLTFSRASVASAGVQAQYSPAELPAPAHIRLQAHSATPTHAAGGQTQSLLADAALQELTHSIGEAGVLTHPDSASGEVAKLPAPGASARTARLQADMAVPIADSPTQSSDTSTELPTGPARRISGACFSFVLTRTCTCMHGIVS